MKYTASIVLATLMFCAHIAGAQNIGPDQIYSVKAHVGIGIGKAYAATSSEPEVDLDKSGNTSFSIDFRYRLWQKHTLSLGLNGGLGYAAGNQTFSVSKLMFNYMAGTDADMDGDTYRRYTTVENMLQEIKLGEICVPVYVDFNWQFCERVSLYAQAGIALRFATIAKVNSLSGKCTAYGVYPKYDNLTIDADWLNDFGQSGLSEASSCKPAQNSFTMSIGAGAGARVWIYGPFSLECGVNYDHGLMNRLKAEPFAIGDVSAESAPVTYTVDGGRQAKSLSSAFSSYKLSNLSLNIGLIFNF